jgi:cytidine deaminase
MNDNEIKKAIDEIIDKLDNAYAKYSNFRVGSLVVSETGKKYFGVNVENKSYGLSICAERAAITSAVTDGMKKIKTIIIVGETKLPLGPCGACREVISEFADESAEIIFANVRKDYYVYKINDILPMRFMLDK